MSDPTGLERTILVGARSRRLIGGIVTGVAILVGGLLAGGCGSSSGSTTKSTATTASAPAPTKAQFLARGNAICMKGDKQVQGAEKSLGKPTEAQFLRYVVGPFAAGVQEQIDGLRALGAPSGEQVTVAHMLDLAQADLNRVKADPRLLDNSNSPFHDFSTLAHPYGLTACAEHT